ncbi:MAG: tetratricopeptide repeat protein [Bacteroidales bacterium]|nr:tetratricopeptide repeat protein [Bacteroidales bacterium]
MYMKRLTIILIVLVSLVVPTACHHKVDMSKLDPDDALQQLDIQIHRHPKDASLYYARAEILMSQSKANEAIADLNMAVSLDDSQTKYYMLLADAQFANGNVEQSYKALSRANELDPDNKDIYLKMGEITFYSRDYDRSLDHLNAVTKTDPDNRTALFMKSFIYKEKGDTANAVLLLRKVCDLYPDYAPAYEELGVLYATRLNPLAADYLNTAITLEPTNTNALYALAMYHQEREEMQAAEELYVKMLDIDDRNPNAWHNRGYIEMMYYDDYEHAVEYFTRALDADPSYIEALLNRALAFKLIGDKSRARADYEAALAIDPHCQPAIDGLKRI